MSKFERKNIRSMHGYSWGEQPEGTHTLKLNTNENPYPASPAVTAALQNFSPSQLRVYPQPTADNLRKIIADHHNLHANQVVMTNGGDEALRLAFTTFVEVAGRFATTDPSYSLYKVLADIHGAQTIKVALEDGWQLPNNLAETLNSAQVELTCIVSPHAPSGAYWQEEQLHHLADRLNGLLLIDEAYADFVDPELAYPIKNLVDRHDNVLILRSFSKGYGLAGLRLGYLLGGESLIQPILEKTRDSYNISAISQALGEAAFSDQDYANEIWQQVRDARTRLTGKLRALGFAVPSSQANFVLATLNSNKTNLDADRLYQALKKRGILVRYFPTPPTENSLRISVGTPAQNDKLVEAISVILNNNR